MTEDVRPPMVPRPYTYEPSTRLPVAKWGPLTGSAEDIAIGRILAWAQGADLAEDSGSDPS